MSRNSDTTYRINRRRFAKSGALLLLLPLFPSAGYTKRYMEPNEAQQLIWGDKTFVPYPIELSKEQMKSIKKSSKTRVRNKRLNSFRSIDGDWFILDQVIGKHENIDIAVGIDRQGHVKGIEVLEYRESYGHQIMNPKWRAQFIGRDSSAVLKLDKQIKNISGATLSCRHITDGINRLTHTWDQILRHSS